MTSKSALRLWREKLAFLRSKRAIESSPSVLFQLDREIEECLKCIRELEADETDEDVNRVALPPNGSLAYRGMDNKIKETTKSKGFDVFLCHNSQDKPEVIEIANRLKEKGIKPWLDRWELRPGLSWQKLLEEQIEQIHSVAVFVGKNGIGPWQERELRAFLDEFVSRGCPVIPVLLPDAPQKPELPIFLKEMMWVDFRQSDPEPLSQLIWGITGINPNENSVRTPPNKPPVPPNRFVLKNLLKLCLLLSLPTTLLIFFINFFNQLINQQNIKNLKAIVSRCSEIQDSKGNCTERVEALKSLIGKKVDLSEINLEKAELSEINLDGARFPNSNLSNASFFKSSLVNSDLSGGKSDLFRADFRLANLSYSNLSEVVLFQADLSGANLNKTNFSKAKAPSANFSFADLREADLTEANLQKANLRGADLRGANLTNADLQNADLTEANLRGANLREIKIVRDAIYSNNHFIDQITSACFWQEARYSDDVLKLLPKEDSKNSSPDCSSWQE